MSTEDFDNILQQGLDKDARSLFGYTKAYNEALTQKYYAEEMPKKLQDISTELFKDPYAYKDTEAFEQAATAAIDAAYDDADKLLGDNAFSSRAHAILKNKTRQAFINQERAKYIQKLPEITAEIQNESAFRQFSDISDFDQTGATIEGALASAYSKMNRKDASKLVTKAYLNAIDVAIENDELAKAEELMSQLNSEDGEGRRKFNGQEIFNTASNRIKLEDLENKLEQQEYKSAQISQTRATKAVADLNILAEGEYGLMKDEDQLDNYLDTLESDITTNGTVTLGEGEDARTYDDPIIVDEVRKRITQIRNSKDYFAGNIQTNFIAQNAATPRKLALDNMASYGAIAGISKPIADKLFREEYDPITNTKGRVPTTAGVEFVAQFENELFALGNQVYDEVKHLPMGEREVKFKEIYSNRVAGSLADWRNNYINGLIPEETEEKPEDSKYYSKEEEKILIDSGFNEKEIADIKKETIAKRKFDEASMFFDYAPDGERSLKGAEGIYYREYTIPSYKQAKEQDLFKDAEEQIKGFNVVRQRYMSRPAYSQSTTLENLYSLYTRKPWFRELTITERANRSREFRNIFGFIGIDANELINNKFDSKKQILVTDVFSGSIDFSSFPIIINGDIGNIVRTLEAYDRSGEPPPIINEIANTYGLSIDAIMNGQRKYLTENNFIRN